jgi:hypothetical protein
MPASYRKKGTSERHLSLSIFLLQIQKGLSPACFDTTNLWKFGSVTDTIVSKTFRTAVIHVWNNIERVCNYYGIFRRRFSKKEVRSRNTNPKTEWSTKGTYDGRNEQQLYISRIGVTMPSHPILLKMLLIVCISPGSAQSGVLLLNLTLF